MIGFRKIAMLRRHVIVCLCVLLGAALQLSAQVDRRDVRAGNRKYRRGDYKDAEIDYRKAVVKDSLSVPAQYNLASTLYRQEDYEGAAKTLSAVGGVADGADYWYNKGDVALRQEDYAGAVEAFRQALLRTPGDMDAKENYVYAKKKLQDSRQDSQQGGGDGQQEQRQDDGNDGRNPEDGSQDNQDSGKGQPDGDGSPGESPQPREGAISPQQAQQMLQAIQAKEKETQDKVGKEKAKALKSRQKDRNW